MSEHDAKAMGELAESLIWPAIDLVGLVRGGEGDREAIGEFLSAMTEQERWALPVILAAMVDHDRAPADLFGWISFDEHGRPLREPRALTPRWRTQVEHGTAGMFARHIAAGETPCDACEAANAKQAIDGIERKRLSRLAAKEAA